MSDDINKIVIKNQKLIWKQVNAKLRKFPVFERDELFNVGFIAAKKAVTDFRPEKGHKLSTCITTYVFNALSNYLQKEYNYRKRRKYVPIDGITSDTNQAEIKDLCARIMKFLPPDEQDIFLARANDISFQEYTKKIGISRTALCIKVQKIRKRLQRILPHLFHEE